MIENCVVMTQSLLSTPTALLGFWMVMVEDVSHVYTEGDTLLHHLDHLLSTDVCRSPSVYCCLWAAPCVGPPHVNSAEQSTTLTRYGRGCPGMARRSIRTAPRARHRDHALQCQRSATAALVTCPLAPAGRMPHASTTHWGFQATSHRCPSGSWK
jgi:hypothetical protein